MHPSQAECPLWGIHLPLRTRCSMRVRSPTHKRARATKPTTLPVVAQPSPSPTTMTRVADAAPKSIAPITCARLGLFSQARMVAVIAMITATITVATGRADRPSVGKVRYINVPTPHVTAPSTRLTKKASRRRFMILLECLL